VLWLVSGLAEFGTAVYRFADRCYFASSSRSIRGDPLGSCASPVWAISVMILSFFTVLHEQEMQLSS